MFPNQAEIIPARDFAGQRADLAAEFEVPALQQIAAPDSEFPCSGGLPTNAEIAADIGWNGDSIGNDPADI